MATTSGTFMESTLPSSPTTHHHLPPTHPYLLTHPTFTFLSFSPALSLLCLTSHSLPLLLAGVRTLKNFFSNMRQEKTLSTTMSSSEPSPSHEEDSEPNIWKTNWKKRKITYRHYHLTPSFSSLSLLSWAGHELFRHRLSGLSGSRAVAAGGLSAGCCSRHFLFGKRKIKRGGSQ